MKITPDEALAMTVGGASARVETDVAARFNVGDSVVVRNINPTGHTRMPQYIRGKRGEVVEDYGVFVFPDTHAHGGNEKPQHLYSVKFSSNELWGREGVNNDSYYVDVFDDYMDPA